MFGQRREVVGIVIHVMAVAHLAGPAVASSVMGNNAIAVFEEEQHLRVPIIGRERPAVAEHDGLTFAPVLVEDLDAVLRSDRAHSVVPCKRWDGGWEDPAVCAAVESGRATAAIHPALPGRNCLREISD